MDESHYFKSKLPDTMATDTVPAEEIWRHPDPASTPMWHFIQEVNEKHSLGIQDYQELYKWSIENVGIFWEEVWHFVGVKASQPYDKVRGNAVWCLSMCMQHIKGGKTLVSNPNPAFIYSGFPRSVENADTSPRGAACCVLATEGPCLPLRTRFTCVWLTLT